MRWPSINVITHWPVLSSGLCLDLLSIFQNTFSPSPLPLAGALVMDSWRWGCGAQRQAYLVRCWFFWGWVAGALTQSTLEKHLPTVHKSFRGLAVEGYFLWQTAWTHSRSSEQVSEFICDVCQISKGESRQEYRCLTLQRVFNKRGGHYLWGIFFDTTRVVFSKIL